MKQERTFPIDVYLKDSKHPKEIKQMMMDLFRGRSKTMDEWKNADELINNRRCK